MYLVYVCTFEIVWAVLQQNFNWDSTADRFWIARVFKFNGHHSTWCSHHR
jgi:hypothetical protein